MESERLTWDDVPELLDELHDMACRLLRRWPQTNSLQPTLLVNTALRRQRRRDQAWEEVTWSNRAQFFGQVFRAMNHRLVEHRRHQRTCIYAGRHPSFAITELDHLEASRSWADDPDLLGALDLGLAQLQVQRPELARLVQYRFFTGLVWDDVAKMMDCSPATVKRRWKEARHLMQEAIERGAELPRLADA